MHYTKNKGFTLIELLIVIAIIGILATLVIVQFGGSRASARDAKRQAHINQLTTALELQYLNDGNYPVQTDCWSSNAGCWDNLISSSYVKDMPQDPTLADLGNCNTTPNCFIYHYCSDGNDYVLVANLENPLPDPMGAPPSTPIFCPHGGPNHFWSTN